ncbi:MAG TPA: xanthine dehydrogenase family protein molybdopterin-binding subunit [Acidimicrobiia bacterium]|nr:xanthine dehydrogenase family protein molybdopterin-binding subunit [Acidimicrobiia bacterium]
MATLIPSLLGAPVQRAEDPTLIRGQATFTEDLNPSGTLHVAFVRSPFAHARIVGINLDTAMAADGVWAIYTGADVADLAVPPQPDPARNIPRRYALAQDRVLMPGDPVAAVVASSPAQARDAADLVEVDYEPLVPVGDPEDALEAPPIHPDQESNVAYDRSRGEVEAVKAMEGAVVITGTVDHPRVSPAPMEGRVALAQWRDGMLHLHMPSQGPHLIQEELARCFDLPLTAVRVTVPFVGGAFGGKFDLAEEELLVAWAARRLARPVKWTETRREHLLTVGHGRAMRAAYRLVADSEGRIQGLFVDWLVDLGCRHRYTSFHTITPRMGTGNYDIAHYAWRIRGVWTNRSSRGIYRGAGRPEATLTIERAVDHLASHLGLDPAEVRRRNFISSFPYKSAGGYTYDSGDYHANLDRLLEGAGYQGLRRQQQERREQGKLFGIGVSAYVEVCGFEDWGAARIQVNRDGTVSLFVETLDQGQGHRTAFAQVVAARLGLRLDQIRVEQGDTGSAPYGHGTSGSRSVAQGGSAAYTAAGKVAEKAIRLAAHLLEADPADLELVAGEARVKGTDVAVPWQAIADLAFAGKLPPGEEPGLEGEVKLRSGGMNFPFGAHLAVVEIDRETGVVTLLKMVGVDDAGVIVNPMLAEGQRHGGMAQGISQALWEAIRYDRDGNLLTSTLMDYLIPTASSLPSFDLDETVTPTPTNPLGAKGIGEAGAIGATPAVINAVCDALSRQDLQIPLTPESVWRALGQGEGV